MKIARGKLSTIGGATAMCLVLVLMLVACSREPRDDAATRLPALVTYKSLPTQFDERLRSSFEEVRSRPGDVEAVRKLARLYHANGLYSEARACYRVVSGEAQGLTARDHYFLADIAQNESNLAEAEKELRASLTLDSGYLPARLALANALFKAGNEAGAEEEFTAVLKQHPDQPQASLGLVRIDLQKGADDAALARLEELTAAHPESAAAAALLAQVLERLGQTDRAVAVAQGSLQKPEPPLADPWMTELLADCYDIQRLSLTFEEYFKLGQMDAALPLLNRLAELDPNSPITKIFTGFSHARALQHIAAVREYYAALASGGDPEKVCPYLAKSLLELGKVSEAESVLADYSAKLPESIPLAKAYAEVVGRRGDDPLLRSLLTKILEKEPYLYQQNMGLAKILWTAGERDLAVKNLQRVATAYASDVPSRALLGEYYLDKGDPFTAIQFLEEAHVHAAASTPAQAGLSALLGTAYVHAGNGETEKGRLAQAAECYDKAIRFAPTEIDAYAGKANACVQLKQFSGAAEALGRLTSLVPGNPTVFLSLGDVLYQNGEKDQASRNWQKALELTPPSDSELRAVLEERLAGRITPETFK